MYFVGLIFCCFFPCQSHFMKYIGNAGRTKKTGLEKQNAASSLIRVWKSDAILIVWSRSARVIPQIASGHKEAHGEFLLCQAHIFINIIYYIYRLIWCARMSICKTLWVWQMLEKGAIQICYYIPGSVFLHCRTNQCTFYNSVRNLWHRPWTTFEC